MEFLISTFMGHIYKCTEKNVGIIATHPFTNFTLNTDFSVLICRGKKKNKTKTLLHSRHYCFCSKHRKQISNVLVGKHRKVIFYTFKKIGVNITCIDLFTKCFHY